MSMYVPIPLFFGVSVTLFIMMIVAFKMKGIPAIIVSLLSTFTSLYLSMVVVNGQLVENVGGLNPATGAIVQGVTVVTIPSLAYVFIFIALVMGGLTIYNIGMEIQNSRNNKIELDF